MKYFLFHKIYDLTGNEIIAQDYDVMALRYGTAKKLKKANKILRAKGYGIVLFDAFRSYDVQQKLGNHYRYIMNSPVNNRTYIEDPGKSRHQKGCAVDVGLYDIKTGKNLAMPTDYFTLDNTSAALYDDQNIEPEVKRLRILQKAMKDAGFTMFTGEWWHFDDFELADKINFYNGNIYEVLKGIKNYY
jgi:D-alanyl-D-alanine dipeptidase